MPLITPERNAIGFRKDYGISTVTDGTYTYAITDGESIKIGKSNLHPWERCKDLQTGNPRNLAVVGWTQEITEAKAHRLLSRWHERGEWFQLCLPVLKAIAEWEYLDEPLWDSLVAFIRRGY